MPATCAAPTTPSASGPHRPPTATSGATGSSKPRSRRGRRRSIPATASSPSDAGFADLIEGAGLAFVGPTPAQLDAFGSKHTARDLAEAAGVPLLPGSGLLDSAAAAVEAADRIGYPVILKATAGGGGIGMRICTDGAALRDAFADARRHAKAASRTTASSWSATSPAARHVEVQVFGDGEGTSCVLGDRDCSLQRRHQKVVEEAPAPGLPDAVRSRLHDAARGADRFGLLPLRGHGRDAGATSRPRSWRSSRSTRASRSSTRSPRRSPASTWWSGWCGSRPATRPSPPS